VRVLIMDEPTASLSAYEVRQLFKLANSLREQGVAILFVSHRLEEISLPKQKPKRASTLSKSAI